MPIELIVAGVVLTLCLVVGVPTIKATIHLPRELIIDEVPDGQLSDRQSAHFADVDRRMAELGYRPVRNVRVSNLQGANLTRVYESDVDPALAWASALRSEVQQGTTQTQDYVEWITRHADGTTLLTRNAEISTLFDPLPHQIHQSFPGLDLRKLKERHDRKAKTLLLRGPVYVRGRDAFERFRDFHRRFCDYQRERGLLVRDAGADLYRPTTRLALRGVAAYFNPLADNFTPLRFALGLVLGSLLPAWRILAVQDASSPAPAWIEAATGLPARIAAQVLLVLAFSMGGAAVGYLFTSKSFVWGLLLGYLPLRMLGGTRWELLLLVPWMGWAADRVTAWRFRRQRVV